MRHMTGFPLIDIHQHVIPDVYRSALARIGVMGSGENPWPQWSMARTLELMDENGIAGTMFSIASPGAYFGDAEFTRGLVRDCNEALARMVADWPGKFGAMGFVPLPDVAAAAREVDYVLDVLELDGINLLTHTGDRYLGHPEEDELYAALDAAVPSCSCTCGRRRCRRSTIPPAIPSWCSTPRAPSPSAVHRNAGEIPQHPLHHVAHGRRDPFLLFRLSGLDDEPKLRARFPTASRPISGVLLRRRAVSGAAVVSRAARNSGPSRILFGTDYPFARNAEKVRRIRSGACALRRFDATLKRKIALDNARVVSRFANPRTSRGTHS